MNCRKRSALNTPSTTASIICAVVASPGERELTLDRVQLLHRHNHALRICELNYAENACLSAGIGRISHLAHENRLFSELCESFTRSREVYIRHAERNPSVQHWHGPLTLSLQSSDRRQTVEVIE